MKKNLEILLAALFAFGCVALGGCAVYKAPPQTMFDLGPLPAAAAASGLDGLRPIGVAEPSVPPWLDSREMYYRLNYANDLQLHPYANSRWSMPPIQLFEQRLKLRIAQAGGQVLSASESASNVPLVLHIEADDFTQTFDSPAHSGGQVALRASVFSGRGLLAQKSFSRQADAPSADAGGGAKALAIASDAVIAEILQWLTELPPKQ
jgi:cholesterol transport system auxiliary component